MLVGLRRVEGLYTRLSLLVKLNGFQKVPGSPIAKTQDIAMSKILKVDIYTLCFNELFFGIALQVESITCLLKFLAL